MSTEIQQAQFRFIAVRDLNLSPLNIRKTGGELGIEQLADLIHAEGVLQNLNVYEEDRVGDSVIYAVVAGGRRWRALQLLLKHKRINLEYLVPCMVVSHERAMQISLSENSGREPMHQADEFEAFRQLIDAGQSVEDVAARFGLTPLTVQRRLKLANVAPEFIALYREEKLTLEHLMAFAVTDDQERQQEVWESFKSYDPDPRILRERLIENEIPTGAPVARFVGLKAYRKAGGVERRDLFSEEDEVMLDATLVRTLAQQKLEKQAEKLRAEGLAWVEVHPTFDYATRSTYGRVRTIRREPTAEEKQSLQELEARQAELEALGDTAQEGEEEAQTDEAWEEIQTQLSDLHEQLQVPDPQQAAVAGAVVHIGRDGKVCIERNLLKPKDAQRLSREQKESKRTEKSNAPRVHSSALVGRLTAQRTLALQAELVQQPMMAVVALAHRLVLDVFYPESGMVDSAVRISASDTGLVHHTVDLEGAPAGETLAAHRKRLEASLPKNPDDLLAWLTVQSSEDLLALLAYCVATAVDGVRVQEGPCALDDLAQVVKLDMRRWWTATAKSYFGSVPKSQVLAVIREVVSPGAAAAVEKLKKRSLAEEAERRLADKGWLPELMRTPA